MEAWFEEINQMVGNVFHHLDLFKKLFEIIDKNERLKSMDGTVVSWMRASFIFDMVIRIGRICDTSSKKN